MIATTRDNLGGYKLRAPIDKRRWVVVEAQNRTGFLGGTEPLAIEYLREAGILTFWPHYLTTRRLGQHLNWKDRREITVLCGYYPPWLFAEIDGDPVEVITRIKRTRYVADVLWAEHDRHYLEPEWLPWIVSGHPHPKRIDRLTGRPLMPPACIDPAAGLFEPPDRTAAKARAAALRPGDRVRTLGKWARFEEAIGCRSIVKAVNGDGTVEVSHVQLFGADATAVYEPEQVERA